jgi:hypothetical protein
VTLASGARSVRRIAWALWLASLGLLALGGLLQVLSASTSIRPTFGFRGVDLILGAAFSTVGVVIALRRPANPIGWLFGATGLGFAVVEFAGEYAVYAVLTQDCHWAWKQLAGRVAVANHHRGDSRRVPAVSRRQAALVPLAADAPVGRHWLSDRGSWVCAYTGAADRVRRCPQSLWLGGSRRGARAGRLGGELGLGLALLAAGASLVLRFRRARGEQRQQLKWVAYAAGLAAIAEVASVVSFGLLGSSPLLLVVLAICGLVAIPVGAAVAILRYRL